MDAPMRILNRPIPRTPAGASRTVLGLLSIAHAFVLTGFLAGCAAERDPRDLLVPARVGVPVVDAVLVVDKRMPAVYLTRTVQPGVTFDTANAIIPGATVRIDNLDTGESVAYSYSEPSARYLPLGMEVPYVRPETTYRLTAVLPSGDELRATTRTPPAFRVDDWVVLENDGETLRQTLRRFEDLPIADSVYHAPDNQIEYSSGLLQALLDRPDVPAFQVGLSSLDLDSDFVIDPDFFEEEDFEELDRISSSPPLVVEDGVLRLPWFAIFFEGRYLIKVFAMDRNWFDAARSIPELSQGGPGFGGNAGDDFSWPIFHVEGGIGLFGSASVDSIGFVIHPRP